MLCSCNLGRSETRTTRPHCANLPHQTRMMCDLPFTTQSGSPVRCTNAGSNGLAAISKVKLATTGQQVDRTGNSASSYATHYCEIANYSYPATTQVKPNPKPMYTRYGLLSNSLLSVHGLAVAADRAPATHALVPLLDTAVSLHDSCSSGLQAIACARRMSNYTSACAGMLQRHPRVAVKLASCLDMINDLCLCASLDN
jgi:hypothetical protein